MRHAVSSRHRCSSTALAAISASALLWLLDATAPAATIYKCTAADGTVAFADKPCATAASQSEVSLHGATRFGNPPPGTTPSSPQESATASAASAEPKDCSSWIPPPWKVAVEPPPEPDYSAYPKDEAGRPILVPGATVQVVARTHDERDAISVQSECTAMLDGCFHKDNDKRNSYDACFNSAPRCKSSRPWEENKPCCPDSCWQQYADLRSKCVDPFSASTRVFFKDHCVPGVAESLGGGRPP